MFSSGIELDNANSLTVQLPSNSGDLSVRTAVKPKRITSFSDWMQAWNIYLAVCVDHMPSRAPSLVAYQCIITSASVQYPLESWLTYDVQFWMLAASDPSLRWDMRHANLWLQCLTSTSTQQPKRWPCIHCGAINHYPDHCPFRPHIAKQAPGGPGDTNRGQLNIRTPTTATPPTRTIPHLIHIQDIAGILTVPHANVRNVNLLTGVKSVVPVIQHEFAQPSGNPRLPIKSQPWIPIRSFLLERELSFHPDKVLVRQLIDDLQHGCSIGYTGPQFAHQANNLLSAHQQTTVIDTTLQKECAVGCILGPF